MIAFAGATALVSGASSGIGLGLAHALVARGARVAITGTNPTKLDAALATFPDRHSVLPLRFDVTDELAWRDAAIQVSSELGPIRFLALNAGIGMGGETIEQTPTAIWNWAWDVNVMGVVHGIQACLPAMRTSGLECHVLMTSSIAGVWRCPTAGAYIVSKSAVVALAETMRVELTGTAVGTSLLLAGAVRTDLPNTSKRSAPVALTPNSIADMKSVVDVGLDPDDVGSYTLDRILGGAFYIFTHDPPDGEISSRQVELTAAMGMTLRR